MLGSTNASLLGMPAFVNPDTIGLHWSGYTPRLRILTLLFSPFGIVAFVTWVRCKIMNSVGHLLWALDGMPNYCHPVTQAFLSVANNNIYTFCDDMRQTDCPEFVKTMEKDINNNHMHGHWRVVKQSKAGDPKTIIAIWLFKRKQLPNGTIARYKACLCAHGRMPKWGVNYQETFSLVVNWMSICLILILTIVYDLTARTIDFVIAFLQAELEVPVFMELPI